VGAKIRYSEKAINEVMDAALEVGIHTGNWGLTSKGELIIRDLHGDHYVKPGDYLEFSEGKVVIYRPKGGAGEVAKV